MDNPSNCWVCGRTSEEVRASQVDESQAEAEYTNQLAQLAQYKSKLMKSAGDWRKSVPKDFKAMEFDFIVGNPSQFTSFSAIADVTGAKKEIIGWLANASLALRNQNESELQALKLSTLRSEDRARLLKSLEEFESQWHRLLAAGDGKDGRKESPVGFKGLNLVDGIEYLIAGGSFYYDVLGMLVQFAREEKGRKAPKLGVGFVPLKGMGRVPICDVCRGLIIELREAGASEIPSPEVAPAEKAEEESSPRTVAPVAQRVPPRRM